MNSRLISTWLPTELMRQAQRLDLIEFLMWAGTLHALVIDVRSGNSQLALGLAASSAARKPTGEVWLQTEMSLDGSSQPASDDGDASRVRTAVPAEFMRGCCLPVLIRTRSKGNLRERVTFGRSTDRDIVLLESSVSKLHGWFELNSQGSLFVTDGGSSNGTIVNRAMIAKSRDLAPGDVLHLGRVRCCVCAVEGLWKLARA